MIYLVLNIYLSVPKNLANIRTKIVHFKNINIFLKSARIKHLILNYEKLNYIQSKKDFYWFGQSCFSIFHILIYFIQQGHEKMPKII